MRTFYKLTIIVMFMGGIMGCQLINEKKLTKIGSLFWNGSKQTLTLVTNAVMKLTKQTDYAFRILMFCAASGSRLSRISDISRVYGASEPFLFKILQPLVEAEIIETVRGRNGGIRLARQPSEITLGEVARLTEDNFTMAECFERDESNCPLLDNCRLTTALREALEAFMEVLDKYTVDDLAKPSAAVITLLAMVDSNEASTKGALPN